MARMRRIGGVVAAVLGLLALAPVAGAATDPAAGWPMFRGAADRTGSTSASSITPANVASLAPGWHYQASATTSSPAVVGGVAYVGSSDHNLYAFAADGHGCTAAADCPPLWKGPTGGQIESSPAVAGGVVYTGSTDHLLYAFDASGLTGCSGTPAVCPPLWTASTENVIESSPVVAGGVVYIGSNDGNLYGFDAAGVVGCSGSPKTCTSIWMARTGAPIMSTPAVVNGVVYVGSDNGKLQAYDATGVTNCTAVVTICEPLWTANIGSPVQSSPAVAGGVVYVGSNGGGLYAFDAAGVTGCSGVPKTCSPLWTAPTGGAVFSSPAVAGGVVYVGSFDKKLYAFDAGGVTGCTGTPKVCAPLWTAATGAQDLIISSPAVANGLVFIGGGQGDRKVYAFDAAGATGCSGTPKTCLPLWTGDTPAAPRSSAAVAGGMLYVGSDASVLSVFALPGAVAPALDRYHPLVPQRILDTRNGGQKLGPDGAMTLQVTGVGGVPASGVSAVVLNVTVTEPTADSFLTVWPAGQAKPLASNLNFRPGQAVPNLVTVKVGAGGQVGIYNLAGATHVVADVSGWYGAGGAGYTTVAPARILDSRSGDGWPAAKLGTDAAKSLQVTGRGGVPADGVSAVVLNVTVTEPTAESFLTAWPTGQTRPLVSNLNYMPGQTVPNLVVVKVGTGGQVDLYNLSGATHVVADVAGWFGADAGAGFSPVAPARILDTRSGNGAPVGKLGPNGTMSLQVTGRGGVPGAGVSAVVLNVTVTEPTAESFLTVWPAGQAKPLASNLNWLAGRTVPNLVVVKVGAGGKVNLYNLSGTAHVIADVAGWYA